MCECGLLTRSSLASTTSCSCKPVASSTSNPLSPHYRRAVLAAEQSTHTLAALELTLSEVRLELAVEHRRIQTLQSELGGTVPVFGQKFARLACD
jgi:hypothetical protein